MSLTLFHSPDSRSSRLIWLLEELGPDYELHYTNIRRRAGLGDADPTNPHPDKRVPALVHGKELVTEVAAIALYLTDLAPESALSVRIGDPLRGSYLTWLAFYAGEIEPAFAARIAGHAIADERAEETFSRVTRRVVAALESGPYLLGDRLTAADILVSGPFEWFSELVPDKVIGSWVERLLKRDAAQRWLEKDDWPARTVRR
jgi:glutathione S-transferase